MHRRTLTKRILAVVLSATLFASCIGADYSYFAETADGVENETETVTMEKEEEITKENVTEDTETEEGAASVMEEPVEEVSESTTEEVTKEITEEAMEEPAKEPAKDSSGEKTTEEKAEESTVTVYRGMPYSFDYYESYLLSTSNSVNLDTVNVYKTDAGVKVDAVNEYEKEEIASDEKVKDLIKVLYYSYGADGYFAEKDTMDGIFADLGAETEKNRVAISEQAVSGAFSAYYNNAPVTNDRAKSFISRIAELPAPLATFRPVLLRTKEGKPVAVSFKRTTSKTDSSGDEDEESDGEDNEDFVIETEGHANREQETLQVTSYPSYHLSSTTKNEKWTAINKQLGNLHGTSYNNKKCAQYAYEALTGAGALKKASSTITECNNLRAHVESDSSWKQATDIYIGSVKVKGDNWKTEIKKSSATLSKNAHNKLLKLIKNGTVRGGDLVLMIKSDVAANGKGSWYGHAAIIGSCIVEDQNGDETFILDHATSSSNAFFTGKNGRGPGSASLKIKSSSIGTASLNDAAIETEGGAGIGFVVYTLDVDKDVFIKIQKESYNAETQKERYDTGFTGIQYDIFTKNENGKLSGKVGTLLLDKGGSAVTSVTQSADSVTYYVQENAASLEGTGYEWNSDIYPVTVSKTTNTSKGNAAVVKGADQQNPIDKAKPYAFNLNKSSADPAITNGNSCYSLAGAEYMICSEFDGLPAVWYPTADDLRHGTNGSTAAITTDINGNTPTVYLLQGSYYVYETKQSPGYKLASCNKNIYEHSFVLDDEHPSYTAKCIEPVGMDPIEINIVKESYDKELKDFPLEGAIFEVAYYNRIYSESEIKSKTPTRRWYLKTDADGQTQFVYGPYATAADGYSSDAFYQDSTTGEKSIPAGSITVTEVKGPKGFTDKPREIYVDGVKQNNAEFVYGTITINSEGEASSSFQNETVKILMEEEPCRGDFRFKKKDYLTGEAMAGIPFKVTSLATKESHIVITDENGEYTSSSSYIKHSVNTNGNDDYETTKEPIEAGLWFAGNSEGKNKELDDAKGALIEGDYILEELPCEANVDKQLIEAVKFTLSGDKTGESVVTVDIGDISNVPSPFIDSKEWDTTNKTHLTYANGTVSVTDTVGYNYLTAGKTYTLKGILMELATGENGESMVIPMLDKDGNYIRANSTFTVDSTYIDTPQEKCGTQDVVFNFESEGLKGKIFVVYEYLFEGASEDLIPVSVDEDESRYTIDESGAITNQRKESIKHDDPEDKDQTGYIPEITTTAWTTNTGVSSVAADSDVEIVDTVDYRALEPDNTYRLEATVMFMETEDADEETEESQDTAESNEENKEGTQESEEKTGNVSEYPNAEKAIKAELTFKPDSSSGSVDITLPVFNAADMKGKTVVIYEKLYLGDALIADETEFDNPDQTIYFTDIHTSAIDSQTEDHWSLADQEVTIIDTVFYKSLTVGKEFTVYGTLMNQSTGEALKDADGNVVTASTTFVPETTSGTVDVIFTFDGSLLAGETVVAFEELKANGVTIATHTDINDESQTIKFPKLSTVLRDKDSGLQSTFIGDNVTLIDSVFYSNVKAGASYRVSGYLMNKDTEQPITINGEKITGYTEFVAEDTSGLVDVTYQFNGTLAGLKNKDGSVADIVCFESMTVAQDFAEKGHYEEVYREAYDETVYKTILTCDTCGTVVSLLSDDEFTAHVVEHGKYSEELVEDDVIHHEGAMETEYVVDEEGLTKDVLIAIDEDINNVSQTVVVPSGKTTALDSESKTHTAYPDEDVTILDTVYYTGLIVGEEYTISGQLYIKPENGASEGEPLIIDGMPVVSTQTFTAQSATGEIVMEFTFSGEALAGKSVVVFEDCYHDGVLVFTHSDITDEDQTIHFPKIGTKATSENGKKKLAVKEEVTLVDTITYENLTVGETYVIHGTVMDASTGKVAVSGKKKITATAEFTPKKANGTTKISFTFSTIGLENRDLVVFEDIRAKVSNKTIATHKDLEDKGQTVTVGKKSIIQTGDTMVFIIFGIVLIGAAAGIIYTMYRRKRNTAK